MQKLPNVGEPVRTDKLRLVSWENTIHSARRITLDEINERWMRTEMSGGLPFSRTTFVVE